MALTLNNPKKFMSLKRKTLSQYITPKRVNNKERNQRTLQKIKKNCQEKKEIEDSTLNRLLTKNSILLRIKVKYEFILYWI